MADDTQGVIYPPPMPMDVWFAEQARLKRGMLLTRTDWVVIRSQETGVAVPVEWAAYRQALRDISAQPGFPENIVWPQQPE